MDNLPVIGITMGDPAGIGPEVIVKALNERWLTDSFHPLIIGNLHLLSKTAKDLGCDLEFAEISSAQDARVNRISVFDMGNLNPENVEHGKISADCGRASVEWILEAGRMALNGEIDAIATAPIHKEAAQLAGYNDIGHMELLQKLSGAKEVATMLTAGNLRVVHLTTHRSLARAVEFVKRENVLAKIELTYNSFKEWGFSDPRIAVAALNPHGGDGGLIGREEIEEIVPAVNDALALGINVTGPIPADSVFPQAINDNYDVVVVLYHDQGHIPIKVKDFEGSISINLGFPFTRTSVDHGTAFDIAGKGIADATGMIKTLEATAFIANTGNLPAE
jgi:4-hydroxythreonine-4-phosphate dehydrogenase